MQLLSWILWAAAAVVPVISTEETSLSRPKRESSEKKIVCYYTNWSVYRPGTAKFSPQNINPYLCTHLIYAFGGLTKDNSLKPFDKYQDVEQGGYAKFNGLKTYNKNLKTMVAIGGWNEGSARFSPLVADPERRKELVKNTVRFLRQNHFDGLDLDWEYPSFRDGGKPRDRENYATLVQEFREEFNRESEKTGRPRLLLTMAVPAGIEYIDKGYDVQKLNKYLDWMNILSYDYHSAFEPAVNHHSPLFSLEEDDEYNFDAQLNIDHTVKHYIKLGADRSKLVLGIPTYGRSYTLFNSDATDIGAPADGPGEQGEATREKGYLAYYEICERIKSGGWTVDNSNSDVMGPYAYKDNQWVGYDDENIVRAKAKYVNEMNLGGIMFWSIDNDDFRGKCHGKPYPLIEAAKEALLADANELLPSSNESRERGSSRKNESTGTKRKSRLKSKTSSTTESGRTKSGRASTTTPQPPTTPDPGSDFTCKEEGFFPHPRDCKKYFWCLDSGPSSLGIVAHQFTCPSGLVFNKISDSCDYARNVICKNKPETSTSTTTTTTTTTTTPRTTTTSKSRIITASPPRTTTTTTTESPEEYEEYEDDNEEEDPGTIKELINLIKKLGGVEQLEKQLNLQGSDDKGKIKPSLYSKVLQGRTGNRYRGVSQETSTSRYVSLFRNRPNAPQSPASEETGEDARSAEKPRYVTIQRNRSRQQTSVEEEEDEEERSESEENRSDRKSGERRRKRPNLDGTTEREYVTIRRGRPLKEETTTSKYRNIVRTRSTTQPTTFQESEDEEEEVEDDSLEETDEDSEDAEEEVTVEEKEPVQKQKKYSSIIRDNKRIVSEVEESKVSGDGSTQTESTPDKNRPFEETTTVNSVYKAALPEYVEIRRGQPAVKTEVLTNDVNNVNISFPSGYLLKNEDFRPNREFNGTENEIDTRLNRQNNLSVNENPTGKYETKGNAVDTEGTEPGRFRFPPRQRPTILSPVAENSQEDVSSASEVFTVVVPDPTSPAAAENDISEEKFIITVTPSPKIVTESTPQNVTATHSTKQEETTTAETTPTSTETNVVTSITESSFTIRRKISRKKSAFKTKPIIVTSEKVPETTTEAQTTFRRFRTTARPSTTTSTTTTPQVRGFRFRVRSTSLPTVETTSERRFIPTRSRNFRKPTPPPKPEVQEENEEKSVRFQPKRPRPQVQTNTEERTSIFQRPLPRRPVFPSRRPKEDLETQPSGSFFKEEEEENSLISDSRRNRFLPGISTNPLEEDTDNFSSEEQFDSEESSDEEEDGEKENDIRTNSDNLIFEDEKEEPKDDSPPTPVQSINDRFFKGRTRPAFEVTDTVKLRNQKTENSQSDSENGDNRRPLLPGRPRFGSKLREHTNENEREERPVEVEEEEVLSDEPERKTGAILGLDGNSRRRRPYFGNQTGEGLPNRAARPRKPFREPDGGNITAVTNQNESSPRVRNQILNRVKPKLNETVESESGKSRTTGGPGGRVRNQLFNRVVPQTNDTGSELNENVTRVRTTTPRIRVFNRVNSQLNGTRIVSTDATPTTKEVTSNQVIPSVRNELFNRTNSSRPSIFRNSSRSGKESEGDNQVSLKSSPPTDESKLLEIPGHKNETVTIEPTHDEKTILDERSEGDVVLEGNEGAGNTTSEANQKAKTAQRRPALRRRLRPKQPIEDKVGDGGTNETSRVKGVRVLKSRILVNATTEQTPKNATQEPSKITTEQPFKTTTEQAFKSTTEQAFKTTTEQAFKSTTEQAFKTTTEQAFKSTTEQAFKTTTEQAFKSTTEQAFKTTTEQPSNTTPEEGKTQEETSEEFSNEILDVKENAKNRTRILLRKRIRGENTTAVETGGTGNVTSLRVRYGNGTRTLRRKLIKKGEGKIGLTEEAPVFETTESATVEESNKTVTQSYKNTETFRRKIIRVENETLNGTEPNGNKTRVLLRKRVRPKQGETETENPNQVNQVKGNGEKRIKVLLRNPARRTETVDDGQTGNRTRVLLRKRIRDRTEADDQLGAEAGRVIPSPYNTLYNIREDVNYNFSAKNSVSKAVEEDFRPEVGPEESVTESIRDAGDLLGKEATEDDKEGREVPPSTTTRTGGNLLRRGNQDFLLKRKNRPSTTTTRTTTPETPATVETPRRKTLLTDRRKFRPETRTLPPKPEVETETTVTSSIRQTPFTRRRIRTKGTTTTTTTTTTEPYKPDDSKLEESQDSSNIPDLADPAVVAIHNLATVSPVPVPASPSHTASLGPVRFGPATPSGFSLQYSPVTELPLGFSTPSRPTINLFSRTPSVRPFITPEPETKISTAIPLRTTALRVKPALFSTEDSYAGGEQARRTTQKPRAFTAPIKETEVKQRKPKPFTKVQKRPSAVIETDDETQPYDYQVYDDVDEDPLANVPPSALKVKVHSDGYIECLDRGNFPHPFSCKKFISCARMENNELLGWEYTCPKHLSFDPVGGICNWSAGLGCQH